VIDPDQGGVDLAGLRADRQFVGRTWTYSLEAVWSGLQQCYAALAEQVRQRYDVELTSAGALGVSAMMHGYLAFDADGELLTPFRTWRAWLGQLQC
jgi:sugar (pentulose or hexulose) kinase